MARKSEDTSESLIIFPGVNQKSVRKRRLQKVEIKVRRSPKECHQLHVLSE